MSIMVTWDATVIMKCNRRRSELFNAALHMKQDISSIEK